MVNYRDENLDSIFSALADPTRRAMLKRLSRGELSVKELAKPFTISKPAISKHLKVLESAGLLSRTIIGRKHFCQIEGKPLSEAIHWMRYYEAFWNKKLDALDAFFKKPNK